MCPFPEPGNRLFDRNRLLLLVFATLSLAYFVFGTYRNWPYKIESDGKYYYQFLVSGIVDRDLDFTNNYRAAKYPWMSTEIDHYASRDVVNPVTGRPTNVFTVGPAVLWAPFFLAAKIAGEAVTAAGFPVDLNPWGKFFQYTVMYSAVVYTVAALYLLSRLLALYHPGRASLHAPVLLLLSTNLCYYAVFEVSMSHVYDLFTYSVYLFLFVKCARGRRLLPCVGLAAAGALHVLVRTQNIVTILIFSAALALTFPWRRDAGRSMKVLGAYGATLSVGLLPIPLINFYLFGKPFAIPQGGQFLDFAHPQVLSVLFSRRNGLFSHHPVLLLGVIGFAAFLASEYLKAPPRDRPGANPTPGATGDPAGCRPLPWNGGVLLFGAMSLAFVLQVYINATVFDWWAGHSFGQRRLVSSFPLFAFGLAWLMARARARSRRWYAFATVALSLSGVYLMLIHVFLWDYDQPHDIAAWMLWHAPQEALRAFR